MQNIQDAAIIAIYNVHRISVSYLNTRSKPSGSSFHDSNFEKSGRMQAEDTGENMKKKKVVIITNAPAPYRVAFFQYIQEHESDYAFHIVYTSENSQIGRQWHVSGEELGSHSFWNAAC